MIRLDLRCGRAALRRNLDARQVSRGPMAAIYSRQDGEGAFGALGLGPGAARLRRRLSRGGRDDPVLCSALDQIGREQVGTKVTNANSEGRLRREKKKKERGKIK